MASRMCVHLFCGASSNKFSKRVAAEEIKASREATILAGSVTAMPFYFYKSQYHVVSAIQLKLTLSETGILAFLSIVMVIIRKSDALKIRDTIMAT